MEVYQQVLRSAQKVGPSDAAAFLLLKSKPVPGVQSYLLPILRPWFLVSPEEERATWDMRMGVGGEREALKLHDLNTRSRIFTR